MITKIEPQSVNEAGLNQVPDYYQSMANNALKDRLGSKTTYSGYLKVVGQQDFSVTVLATETKVTTSPHGISSSIPFVFLYVKSGGYYSRLGFADSDGSGIKYEGMTNATVDSKNFSFTIENYSDVNDKVYLIKALIFEVNN